MEVRAKRPLTIELFNRPFLEKDETAEVTKPLNVTSIEPDKTYVIKRTHDGILLALLGDRLLADTEIINTTKESL